VTSLYGQDKSETHARERLAILLAQRVVRRLQLYFLNQANNPYGHRMKIAPRQIASFLTKPPAEITAVCFMAMIWA
jgi:hypothetical protein